MVSSDILSASTEARSRNVPSQTPRISPTTRLTSSFRLPFPSLPSLPLAFPPLPAHSPPLLPPTTPPLPPSGPSLPQSPTPSLNPSPTPSLSLSLRLFLMLSLTLSLTPSLMPSLMPSLPPFHPQLLENQSEPYSQRNSTPPGLRCQPCSLRFPALPHLQHPLENQSKPCSQHASVS